VLPARPGPPRRPAAARSVDRGGHPLGAPRRGGRPDAGRHRGERLRRRRRGRRPAGQGRRLRRPGVRPRHRGRAGGAADAGGHHGARAAGPPGGRDPDRAARRPGRHRGHPGAGDRLPGAARAAAGLRYPLVGAHEGEDRGDPAAAGASGRGRPMTGTTTVLLAYGDTGLPVDLPAERTTVVEPRYVPGAPDQREVLRTALRRPVAGPPLRELARPGQRVAISMCDGTRAQPRHLMIPAVLEELDGVVDLDDVVVIVATGTHRGNTEAEIRAMLGEDVANAVRVVNHDARDPASLVHLGTHGGGPDRDGVPVWLNRHWVEADLRITTGFVEPHFFAGFSGGPKLVAPGLAGLDTVLTLHDARRIGHPRATWAVCEGNPVHDDIRAVVGAVGRVDFALDVVLNREQQIVEAFGDRKSTRLNSSHVKISYAVF